MINSTKKAVLNKMKRHKAPELLGLVAEMTQAAGHTGTQWLLDLCNGIEKEGCIPEDWKSSVVLPIYEGKGVECGRIMSRGELGQFRKYSNFRDGLYCLVVLAPTCSVVRGGHYC